MVQPVVPAAARNAILAWYRAKGRALPFRATSDPYAILVSEAMAQQTQAERAGEAWRSFLTTYPTVHALARAVPADVLRAWRGLGYNRRALNLWRAARAICERHAGRVPADVAELEALPGVGPYTARAIAAIAFGVPVGAVDTNVRRVLGRIVAGPSVPSAREIQALADATVPRREPGAWTHALMDVGAAFCRPTSPDCDSCPAQPWCRYVGDRESERVTDRAVDRGRAGAHQIRRATPQAFRTTSRWLRGRIVDRLRAAPGDGWTEIAAPIGEHDHGAVSIALSALAREGLIEIEAAQSDVDPPRARLSLS